MSIQLPRASALAWTLGATPCAENTTVSLRHLRLLLDEDRPALAQLLDNVLVVDDLLAHVDGRLHGARRSDRLDRPVHARAVAPAEPPVGVSPERLRHDCAESRRVGSAHSLELLQQLVNALPDRIKTPPRDAMMSSQVSCQQSKSKSMRSIDGTSWRRNGMWSSSTTLDTGREGRAGADATRPRGVACARGEGSDTPSRRMWRPFSPTKSSSTIALASAVAARCHPAAAQALLELRFGCTGRALLAVEEHEDDRLAQATRLDRRASWVTTAVPEAPPFGLTKPGMSLVS